MPALSDYTNVYDTAITVLESKGFQLWVDTASEMFFAEKDGWDFAADSPTALLGVVSIYESVGPTEFREYWWRIEGRTSYRELSDRPRPFVPVWRRA